VRCEQTNRRTDKKKRKLQGFPAELPLEITGLSTLDSYVKGQVPPEKGPGGQPALGSNINKPDPAISQGACSDRKATSEDSV